MSWPNRVAGWPRPSGSLTAWPRLRQTIPLCLLAGAIGCAHGTGHPATRCPEPVAAMLAELPAVPPATRDYLGRVEVFCRAIASRER